MPAQPQDDFETTNWSLVLAAGADRGESRRSLASLCEAYWQPLYAFVRRQGHSVDDARDLTQAFFAHLLEGDALRQIEPGAGRFRAFLLTSMKNLMCDEWRKAQALKRGAGRNAIRLDIDSAERGFSIEPTAGLTPELLYEKQWAASVLQQVLDRLRAQAEHNGKTWEFEHLMPFITGERPTHSYEQVATDLGISPEAVRMAVHRLRKRYGRTLRAQVGATVADPEEVDDEIRFLLSVIRA